MAHHDGPMTLTIICAWCPDSDARTRLAISQGHTVSHGMCPDCVKRMEILLEDEDGPKVRSVRNSDGGSPDHGC